jgi:hypothetical protein
MTRAGKSMFYFAFWIIICGISLMFFPDFCLDLAGISLPDLTVPRLFAILEIVRPVVIGFVAVDALGALWTALALRADMKQGLCVS